jgi:predicted ATP-dependent endonuclease of OLD family
MKYTKFEIKNFKGIKDLTIDLSKQPYNRIHTFVGLNESGKTTILEAIKTVVEGWNDEDAHQLIPKHYKASFNGEVSIIAYIKVDEEDNRRILNKYKELGYSDYKPIEYFTINHCWNFQSSQLNNPMSYWAFNPFIKKIGGREFFTLDDTNEDWQKTVRYIKNCLMPRIVYYQNLLFEFPDRIYLCGPNSNRTNNKPYKDIIEDIIQEVIGKDDNVESSLYNLYIGQDSGSKDIFKARKNRLQEFITREVFSSWGTLFNSTGTTAKIELNFDICKINDSSEEDFYVEIRIEENSDSFYISERSVGFRWFFSFLFFILFRKNRKTDLGETLFLLDEPASNLHSTAQKKLLDTFERFVADDKKPLKLLYTTHSHHMINPKWLEGAFVVRNEAVDYSEPFGNRKVTNITAIPYKHFVAEYPDQQDYFQPILDTLEYQPGLLEKVPNVIITEGKNNYYTLRYVNEVLLKNKYKKIRFLPGIGCNKNHAIIQLYMGWNKSFMVLLDADKAGKKAAKEYLSTFGNIIIPSIKTYKDFVPEIEDVAMENIFTGEEKLAITQRFNETATEYKKSEFNTAIQTALINKEVIELSEETLNKFDNLLKQLNSYKFA